MKMAESVKAAEKLNGIQLEPIFLSNSRK